MPQATVESAVPQFVARPDSRMEREKATEIYYELTCITDGSVQTFFDAGPFPKSPDGKDQPGWHMLPPSGRRQQLLSILRKRTRDGLPTFASPVAGLSVWDKDMQRPIEVPVIDAKWLAASEMAQAKRDELSNEIKNRRANKAAEERKMNQLSQAELAQAMAGMLSAAINNGGKAGPVDVPEPEAKQAKAQKAESKAAPEVKA